MSDTLQSGIEQRLNEFISIRHDFLRGWQGTTVILISEYKAHISFHHKTQTSLKLAHVSPRLTIFSWD